MVYNADISSSCLLAILSNLDLLFSNYWNQVVGRTRNPFLLNPYNLRPLTYLLKNEWLEDDCFLLRKYFYKVQLLVSGWWTPFFGGKRKVRPKQLFRFGEPHETNWLICHEPTCILQVRTWKWMDVILFNGWKWLRWPTFTKHLRSLKWRNLHLHTDPAYVKEFPPPPK